MMKCDNSKCVKEARRIFRDGSKPTTLYLCVDHCHDLAIYYRQQNYLFLIDELDK